MQDIVQHTHESPFEKTKRTSMDGNEFWSARELMEVMGYPRWHDFHPVVKRAMTSAKVQGHDPDTLFRFVPEKSGGRDRTDYWMPRFACYLVAMNGDPRKEQVANGQAYFAFQTRVAETQVPQQVEMSDDEILHRALTISASRVKALEAKVEEIEPKAEAYDSFMDSDGTYSVGNVAKMLGTSQNKLFTELRNHGVLIGKGHMRNTPYQQYMHHFTVKAYSYTRSDGNEAMSYTTRV